MATHHRRRAGLQLALRILSCPASAASTRDPGSPTVADLIRALTQTGVDVIYSSELVPPDLKAPGELPGLDARSRLLEALAVYHLTLRAAGSGRYLIARAAGAPLAEGPGTAPSTAPPAATPSPEPLSEISVFASRYAYPELSLARPRVVTRQDIDVAPGAMNDPLEALRGAPGLATNLSSRPYIRGAELEDVLVEFDGIQLTNAFHFQNFQSLISAFDPFAIGRVDLYTGGFPVEFGTRAGGVLDLAPRSTAAGAEYRAEASLLSYDLATVGHADRLPLEWLVAVRRSADTSLLRPLSATFGEPTFSDAIARLRWHSSERSSWTLGTLLLEDALQVSGEPTEEAASARFHDRYLWLAWDGQPDAGLQGNTSLALTQTDHSRQGILLIPVAVNGSLDDRRDDLDLEWRTHWIRALSADRSASFGAEAGIERAALGFSRTENFSTALATSFAVPTDTSDHYYARPKVATQAIFAALQQRWRKLEAEMGARVDREEYLPGGGHLQFSPRLNLRYDLAPHWQGYGSWGEFTQAQRAGDWRSESAQSVPDPATRAVHQIVGAAHESDLFGQWRLEFYRNHWTSLSPYFTNTLNGVSLVPELEPDRVLLTPSAAETAGLELSARRAFGDRWNIWAFNYPQRIKVFP